MQTWLRVASIDSHCPPSCLPLPSFQSGSPLVGLGPAFLSVYLWAGEQGNRVPGGSFQAEWRARERCGRGRCLSWSLVPPWTWWLPGGIPTAWGEGLLLRSPRSLPSPEAVRVSGWRPYGPRGGTEGKQFCNVIGGACLPSPGLERPWKTQRLQEVQSEIQETCSWHLPQPSSGHALTQQGRGALR